MVLSGTIGTNRDYYGTNGHFSGVVCTLLLVTCSFYLYICIVQYNSSLKCWKIFQAGSQSMISDKPYTTSKVTTPISKVATVYTCNMDRISKPENLAITQK